MSGAADLALFFAMQAFLLLAPLAGCVALLSLGWGAFKKRKGDRSGAGS